MLPYRKLSLEVDFERAVLVRYSDSVWVVVSSDSPDGIHRLHFHIFHERRTKIYRFQRRNMAAAGCDLGAINECRALQPPSAMRNDFFYTIDR